MLHSYECQVAGGHITLTRQILDQLGIGPDGVLYGAFHQHECSLIVSPIPPESWDKAFKVIVHTAHRPGSFATAIKAISARDDLDITSSWASSESLHGHLSTTSTVALSPKGDDVGVSDSDPRELADTIKENILRQLSDAGSEIALSDLDKYGHDYGNQGLDRVLVTHLKPLAVYHNQLKVITQERFYRFNVKGYLLNLTKAAAIDYNGHDLSENENPDTQNASCSSSSERTDREELWRRLQKASDAHNTRLCLVTPHPGEAFMRINLMPSHSRLCRILFEISILSRDKQFGGYWREALEVLKDLNCSVYRAENLIVEKTLGKCVDVDDSDVQGERQAPSMAPYHSDRKKVAHERAKLDFLIDYSKSNLVGKELKEIENDLHSVFQNKFEQLAARNDPDDSVSLPKRVSAKEIRGAGVLCFLATNAKPRRGKIDRAQEKDRLKTDAAFRNSVLGRDVAVELCNLLEVNGFKAVNIDLAQGGIGLQQQVRDLIHACPFMVVLHCPEDRLKLSREAINDMVSRHPLPSVRSVSQTASLSEDTAARPDYSEDTEREIDESSASDKGVSCCGASEWVLFEEAMMLSRRNIDILRIRFDNIKQPSPELGYIDIVISDSDIVQIEGDDSSTQHFELTRDVKRSITQRLQRWQSQMYRFEADNPAAEGVEDWFIDRDLRRFYLGDGS